MIYRSNSHGKRAEQALKMAGIAYSSGLSTRGRGNLYSEVDAVKVVSMHSSKGLEFGLVLIPCLHDMPKSGESETDEARLLYVAMTRAIDRLIMTYREHSDFTRRLQDSISGVRQSLEEAETV